MTPLLDLITQFLTFLALAHFLFQLITMVVLRPGMVPHPYLRRPPVVGPPGRVHHRQGDEDAEPNTANDQSAIPKDDDDTFYPSLDQVQEVREILRHIRKGKEELVPDEVVDMILDEAEYWPSISATLHPAPIDISQDRDKECLRTAPLCIDISDSVSCNPSLLLEEDLLLTTKLSG